MTKLIVFTGLDEVIIGLAKNRDKIIREWFAEAGRDIDDYDEETSNNLIHIKNYVSTTVDKS
jgi:hypothetical protein